MALAELFPLTVRHERRVQWPWVVLLIAMAALSSVTFECVTPFAAFAVLTAATMSLPRALAAMAAVWLVNQALGYLALAYPLDASSLMWGGAIGIAALAAAAAVSAIVAAMRAPRWSRLVVGFVAAVIVYEVLLFLVALVLGGAENFSPGIVAKVALSNAAWLAGIAILRHGLLRFGAIRGLSRRPVTT
jgi:hypothetical protein